MPKTGCAIPFFGAVGGGALGWEAAPGCGRRGEVWRDGRRTGGLDGRRACGAAREEEAGGARSGPPPSTLCLAPRRSQFNRTPLHDAAIHGKVECVKVLVEAGANKDATDKVSPPPTPLAPLLSSRARA